jgi:hypothetical protein
VAPELQVSSRDLNFSSRELNVSSLELTFSKMWLQTQDLCFEIPIGLPFNERRRPGGEDVMVSSSALAMADTRVDPGAGATRVVGTLACSLKALAFQEP